MAESASYVDAYHVRNGLTRMYAVDANTAVSQHPNEWKLTPWSPAEATEARAILAERYAADVENAKLNGLPVPTPLPPEPPPLSPEDQAAIMEHEQAVAEANERLRAYQEKKAAEKAEADQVAADKALIASPPPQPDPTRRRPLTPAQIRKQAAMTDEEIAKKAADDKLVADKTNVDKISGAKVANL